jgi:hypothetical protein
MSALDLKRKRELFTFAAVSLTASAVFIWLTHLLVGFLAGKPEDSDARWLAAVPIAVLTGFMALAMRSLGRMDELERKIHTEAMAFAFLCTIPLGTTYLFLIMAGLLETDAILLLPAMASCWVIGLLLSVYRYR